MPLSGVIVSLAKRTIPLSEREKEEQANQLTILDKNLLGSPRIALEQADKAVILLSDTVGEAFLAAAGILKDPEQSDQVRILCERSQRFQDQIDDYLTQISERDLGKEDRAGLKLLSSANTAFGRMGIVAERTLELIKITASSEKKVTPEDRREIHILGEAISEILQLTIRGFTARTKTVSQTIQYYREEIMNLSELIKKRYIRRVHKEGRDLSQGTLYTDICNAEEQLIDYCDMIADALIRYNTERRTGRESEPEASERTRQQVHMLFRDKYEALEAEGKGD